VYDKADFHEHTIKLKPGDRLYLYSDGLIDATNRKHGQYGRDRFLDAVVKTHKMSLQESISNLMNDVDEWCNGEKMLDDISLLGVEMESVKLGQLISRRSKAAANINERISDES
jgi:serine phosphatase RsbU (regulator of sigma subunit)